MQASIMPPSQSKTYPTPPQFLYPCFPFLFSFLSERDNNESRCLEDSGLKEAAGGIILEKKKVPEESLH